MTKMKKDILETHTVFKQMGSVLLACHALIEEKKEWVSEEELDHCVRELSCVEGALNLIGNTTSALLSNEISSAIRLAQNEESTNKSTALMMSASALKILLESIKEGLFTADANYRLLSVINKLRALQEKKPLPASEVYNIDLDVVPVNQNLEANHRDFAEVAKKQGPKLQTALLSWFQNCQSAAAIDALVDIADSLRLSASERPHIQFFEVIAALIDSQRGCAHVSQSIRLLLAYVERYVRQLADIETEQGYLPTTITKEALYHIAANAYQRSDRVKAILGRYGLRDRRSRKRDKPGGEGLQPAFLTGGGDNVKSESGLQALRECRRELSSLERDIEAWVLSPDKDKLFTAAYERLYRIRHCFDLLDMSRQANVCENLQKVLLAIHQSPEDKDGAVQQLAESIAALSCSIDVITSADGAPPISISELLTTAERPFDETSDGGQDIVQEQTKARNENTIEPEAVVDNDIEAVSDFFEDTESLLVEFDSLIETSELLSVSDDDISAPEEESMPLKQVHDLSESFSIEAADLLHQMQQQLNLMQGNIASEEPVNAILRLLHTLKGAARIAGHAKLGDMSHGLESTLSSVVSGILHMTPEIAESTRQSMVAMQALVSSQTSVNEEHDIFLESEGESEALVAKEHEHSVEEKHAVASVASERREIPIARMLQLNAENLLGQSYLSAEILQAMSAVAEFDPIIHRLSDKFHDKNIPKDSQVRIGEAINDLRLAANQALRCIDQVEKRLDHLHISESTLRQTLLTEKMVAIESDVVAYHSLVEQTASQLGKKVSLRTHGLGLRIDRKVLSTLSAAIGHLVRNAIDHGVEMDTVRIHSGKPETATLSIDVKVDIDGINISVTDDGAGIDLRAIWRKAFAKNLVNDNEVFDESRAYYFLFDAAFSTKTLVTQVSGRGVGLDAVKANIDRLGGNVGVDSEIGHGARFWLSLPVHYGVVPHLIFKVGDHRFGLPGLSDKVVVEIDSIDSELEVHGKTYRCIDLSDQLGLPQPLLSGQSWRAVLFEYQDVNYALIVSQVEGVEKVTSDAPVGQLQQAEYLLGIGLLEEGGLLPILNLAYFLNNDSELAEVNHQSNNRAKDHLAQAVLVVDDSLTIRRYCENLLRSNGYSVLLAKSAEEALTMAGESNIDILLTDLQLPKMDGCQLIDELRRLTAYSDLPAILISASPRDEKIVQQHNISSWLSKPYTDQELFDTLAALTPRRENGNSTDDAID